MEKMLLERGKVAAKQIYVPEWENPPKGCRGIIPTGEVLEHQDGSRGFVSTTSGKKKWGKGGETLHFMSQFFHCSLNLSEFKQANWAFHH